MRTIITSKRSFIPQCSRSFPNGLKHAQSDTVSPFPLRRSDKTRPRLRFALLPLHRFHEIFTSNLRLLWLEILEESALVAKIAGRGREDSSLSDTPEKVRHGQLNDRWPQNSRFYQACTGDSKPVPSTERAFFFFFVFSCYLQLWSSHFTPRAWVQELQARPPGGRGKKKGLSDVTEKKPQQCALLSAPSRGVQQQSTSSELLCLILLCRLCLSFSQTKHKGITPKIARISGCSIKEFSWASTGDYTVSVSSSVFLWNWKGKEKPCWMTCYKCKEKKYLWPNWNHTSGVGAVYRSRLHSASPFVACVIGTFVGLGSSSCGCSTLYTM